MIIMATTSKEWTAFSLNILEEPKQRLNKNVPKYPYSYFALLIAFIIEF
jgi:hypothetical protein